MVETRGYSPGSFEAAGTSITHIVRSGEAERVATAGRVRSVKMLGPGLGSRISAWTLVGATIEIALIWLRLAGVPVEQCPTGAHGEDLMRARRKLPDWQYLSGPLFSAGRR